MTHDAIDDVRAELEPLPWAERFERLHALTRSAAPTDRPALEQLRAQLAEEAMADLSAAWGDIPLKEGMLRLESSRLRGALTRVAKQARDRAIVACVRRSYAPLASRGVERFAVGMDERAIEIPLALQAARLDQPGEVLDAGAALNVPVVREILPTPRARVTHFTLPGANEPVLPGDTDHFTYAYGDLRTMSYGDGTFDRVVCVSTLEHVGMDTGRFGVAADGSNAESAADAVQELHRVLKKGGELLLTVPYGRAAHHEWFRVFDAETLDRLLSPLGHASVERRYFYYDSGWREGDAVPPSHVIESGYAPDVITGVAIVRMAKDAGL